MSLSIACGKTRSSTKVRTVSWMRFCSSESSKSTAQVSGRAQRLGPALLPLVLVGGAAFDNGGYNASTWGWLTLVPLVLVAVALVLNRARHPDPLVLAFLGLLAAFTAWTWVSIAWSDDATESVLEGERLLVYVAATAAFILLGRGQVARLLGGLLAAITLACGWALCLRAFGGSGSYDVVAVSADATRRLAAPLGYSNGLGLFAAIGILLAVGLALRFRHPLLAAPVLVLGPTLYFTYSRGAWLALGTGAVGGLALASPRLPRRVVLVAAAAVAAVIALALVRLGGPARAVHEFSQAGATVKADKNRRLFSLSGSSRAQYWQVAWREVEHHPWLGSGAGSFQRNWLRLRPAELPVLDAHNLYLETLAEVGPIGLALLVALLAVPAVAAVIARRQPFAPPAFAAYLAYAVHAAQDWDWELPAVTLAALCCAAALLVLAEREPRPAFGRAPRAAAVAAAVLLGLLALGALAGNAALGAASAALDADNPTRAARDARWAKQLVPWSAEPWRLHGEALLSEGNVEGARRDFETALRKDPSDWDSWVDLALVTNGRARKEAVERSGQLNPLERSLPSGG
jgi:O-antigen ligase